MCLQKNSVNYKCGLDGELVGGACCCGFSAVGAVDVCAGGVFGAACACWVYPDILFWNAGFLERGEVGFF